MALINCPECSREISDKAASCPHCGLPMAPALPDSVNCLDCHKDFPFDDHVCPHCGLFNSQKYAFLESLKPPEPEQEPTDTAVICPKCRARNAFTAQKKGFSLKKALLIGPVWGLVGKDKVVITCLKCGHKWNP